MTKEKKNVLFYENLSHKLQFHGASARMRMPSLGSVLMVLTCLTRALYFVCSCYIRTCKILCHSNNIYTGITQVHVLTQPGCCHPLLRGVTHDGSATQNFTPFSHGFKYIFRNFNPYFAQKQVQFGLKKNPIFCFRSTLSYR